MKTNKKIHQVLVSREFGGAAEIALQLASRLELASPGQARVWVPGEGHAAERVRSLGLPPLMYDGEGIFSRWRLRAATANVRNAIRFRSRGSGVMHVHSPLVYGAMQYGLRMTSLKRIVHVHIEHALDGLRWAFRNPPDLIVTCAQFLVDQVRSVLPPAVRDRQRIVAVPNAVDTAKFVPGNKPEAKQRLGASSSRPLLLMLANLAPHKGQETAIRAISMLKQRGQNVSCWLAGTDRSPGKQFETKLRRTIDVLGLQESVKLLGYRQDSTALLQAADIVLLPSTNEGLPLTVLEAQACCVPVIAAPTAGIPEIIRDGETGFLVPADDVEGYAARIELLIGNPQLCKQLGERASTYCREHHTWEAYHRKMTDLYVELLG